MRKDPPDPTGPGGGAGGYGHTLGGGGAGGAAGSPSEVRARRLAALGGGGGEAAASLSGEGSNAGAGGDGNGDASSADRHVHFGAVAADDGRLPSASARRRPAAAAAAAAAAPPLVVADDSDGDDDDDLQRALALSLMDTGASPPGGGGGGVAAAVAWGAAADLMDLGSIPDAEVVLANSAFDSAAASASADPYAAGIGRRSVSNRPPTPSPADERKPSAAGSNNGGIDVGVAPTRKVGAIRNHNGPVPIEEDGGTYEDRKLPAQKEAPPAKMESVVVHISSCDRPSSVASSSSVASPTATATAASSESSYARSVHSLLWNDAVTTEGDKERWRGQGIDTTPSMWRRDGNGGDDGGDGDDGDDDDTVSTVASSADGDHAAAAASASAAANGGTSNPNDDVGDDLNNNNNSSNSNNNSNNIESARSNRNTNPIADALGTKQSRWGLTQVHGGPCGVLAAVQAEMLRMLLFGRKRKDDDGGNSSSSSSNNNNGESQQQHHHHHPALSHIATYPRTVGGGEDGKDWAIQATTPPAVEEVREAMALAIGTILARAALAPPASDKEKEAEEKSREDGWVKVGDSASASADDGGKKRNSDGGDGANGDTTADDNFCGVRIVLPTQPMAETTLGDGGTSATAAGAAAADVEPMDVDTDSAPATAAAAAANTYDGLTWDMLSSFHAGTNGTKPQLRVCTISITPENAVDGDEDGLGPESKRQRKDSMGDGSSVVQCEDSFEGRIACLAAIVAKYLLETENASDLTGDAGAPAVESAHRHSPLQYFSADGGVLLLVLSLLESRGLEKAKSDMDDSSSTLTSQFGHSSQELINILLTGQAVSNVFDNHVDMGGALICRGIQSQPAIGYLTQLESHRYCEVGGFYKSPTFPIWLIGSTSHFSVLFGDSRCMIESSSDKLLEKCRRAFRAADGGEDNGFIQVSSLGEVMRSLDLYDQIGADGLQTLKASLEVHGAGIILWSDWWKVASRLLCGASLQSVLQGDSDDPAKNDEPLLLTQFGESGSAPAAAAAAVAAPSAKSGGDTIMSDEELARKLAAEWGTAPEPAPAASAAAAPASIQDAHKSDEELARELQAQWNADLDLPPLERAHNIGNDAKEEAKPDLKPSSGDQKIEEDAKKPAATPVPTAAQNDNGGGSFDMYHYNGLRGGTLTGFRVIKPKSLDAVGSSISMSSHGGTASRDGGDLEDVVRTRWRNCNFDWMGKRAPYID